MIGRKKLPRAAGHARDDEEEHHDRAVKREEAVVRVGVDDRLPGREELEPDEQREGAAERERDQDEREVHEPDPLVIERGQPGPDALRVVEVVGVRVCFRVVRAVCGGGDGCHGVSPRVPACPRASSGRR